MKFVLDVYSTYFSLITVLSDNFSLVKSEEKTLQQIYNTVEQLSKSGVVMMEVMTDMYSKKKSEDAEENLANLYHDTFNGTRELLVTIVQSLKTFHANHH